MQIALQPAPYCAKSQCAHVQRTCRDMRHHKFSEACSRVPEVPAAMLLALRLAPGICKTGTGEADHYNEALRGLRGRISGVCLKRRSEKEKARTARGRAWAEICRILVREAGLEPARCCHRQDLNLEGHVSP